MGWDRWTDLRSTVLRPCQSFCRSCHFHHCLVLWSCLHFRALLVQMVMPCFKSNFCNSHPVLSSSSFIRFSIIFFTRSIIFNAFLVPGLWERVTLCSYRWRNFQDADFGSSPPFLSQTVCDYHATFPQMPIVENPLLLVVCEPHRNQFQRAGEGKHYSTQNNTRNKAIKLQIMLIELSTFLRSTL